jgi:predicted unusual protein kinase regulating ubiquinone biosynthesis (AarF/ABC1/UbiB family)
MGDGQRLLRGLGLISEHFIKLHLQSTRASAQGGAQHVRDVVEQVITFQKGSSNGSIKQQHVHDNDPVLATARKFDAQAAAARQKKKGGTYVPPAAAPMGAMPKDVGVESEDAKTIAKEAAGHAAQQAAQQQAAQQQTAGQATSPAHKHKKFEERDVPATPFSRAMGFAGLGARLAVGALTHSIGNIGVDPNERKSFMATQQNADTLADSMRTMRGAALKIGQWMSLQEESVLPPQLAKALARVREGAHVMPLAQLEKVLAEDLGKDWEQQLISFTREPMAAASIGQVHRATVGVAALDQLEKGGGEAEGGGSSNTSWWSWGGVSNNDEGGSSSASSSSASSSSASSSSATSSASAGGAGGSAMTAQEEDELETLRFAAGYDEEDEDVDDEEAAASGEAVELVMKVQYPGVKESINSDLQLVEALLVASAAIPKGVFLSNIVRVGKEELALECDYEYEFAQQQKYSQFVEEWRRQEWGVLGQQAIESEGAAGLVGGGRSIIGGGYKVPDLVPSLCSTRVLTMGMSPGLPLEAVLGMPQAVRDSVATRLLALTIRELFNWRFMQTDPNMGNFLYEPDTDQLVLLDFGAARGFSEEFCRGYFNIVDGAAHRDEARVWRASEQLGFVTGEESVAMRHAHIQAGYVMGEPFRHENFDFSDSDVMLRLRHHAKTFVSERLAPPPTEAYSIQRRLAGIYLTCIRLQAVVPCKAILEEAETWPVALPQSPSE